MLRRLIDDVDWSAFDDAHHSGAVLAESLRHFLAAENDVQAQELWWGIEGEAFAQNTVYAGAVPTVTIMLAALAKRPPEFLRGWLIEVVRFILSGGSVADPSLPAHCLERARQGTWLLVREVEEAVDPGYAGAVLELLELVDPSVAELVGAEHGKDA